MAGAFADALFWTATTAIAVTQWLILASTWRGMRREAARGHAVREWIFAIAPAIALALLLLFTWRAMHPATVQVEAIAPAGPRA